MRIFQVLELNQFNTGSVHQMFQAAAGLRERGHEVTIVSRPGSVLAGKAAAAGVGFRSLPFRHRFDARSIIGMRALVREFQPDVIHVHKGVSHAVALAATYRQGVGAFIVNRGVSFPLDFWNRGKYRTSRVDRVVTVCRQIKNVIVSSAGLPDEKVEVVYAGTDVALFDPAQHDPRVFRREKAIGEDRFLLAQVGIRDWKGWKDVVDAVAEVASRFATVHLVVIGDIAHAGEVRQYAALRGIEERVTPVEHRMDMPNVLSSCDLVVDASWAGTGITGTIREAMAMEKPVIATNAGGNEELVSSPEVGWLIPMRDHAALTRAIIEVMEDRERAAAASRAARRHVVDGFSKELRISRLEQLYRQVLRSKGRARG
ncbi:MAG TPA: glycosyltransferase family 4 protein [Thermoanaerobaculia bacterium]|nr:glycosyltransferase family 4 protein [Thermoanaerobaculia bacterium]